MPSLRVRFFSALISKTVRRRQWGRKENELARRARSTFGAPRILQWWSTLGLEVDRVASGPVKGEWLSPPRADPRVAIMYIHGGGFCSCSARTHRPITSALAEKTGLPLFAVDYRLAPEHRFPAAVDDVIDGYRWLRQQGIEKIAIAGDSAGGGLVMSLLIALRGAADVPPACAVCFSPWTDLSASGGSIRQNADRDAMFFPENMEEFAAVYLGDHRRDDCKASPLFADHGGLPPVLFQASSTELLLDDSRRIFENINHAGGISEIEVYDDLPHGWQMLHGFVPEAAEALDKAAAFIRKYV